MSNNGVVMKYGDKGRKVKIAQKCLKKAGSKIDISGKFLISMVSAVRSYQKKRGLNVTGTITIETWKRLKKELPFWKRIF